MEVVQSPGSAATEPYSPSPDHQYQKYCMINLSESASSDRFKEKVYKVASIIAMVVGAVLLVGIVAGVAIGLLAISGLAPPVAAAIAALVLVGGTGVYRRVFYEGFENKELGISFGVLPFKKKEIEHRRSAEIHESVAKMAEIARERNPSLSKPQSNLVGRIMYWSSVADQSMEKMSHLRQRVRELNDKIIRIQQSCTPEELKQLKGELDQILRDLNHVTATEHVAAKVKAAYFHHIALNPSETHSFEEFGKLETDSFLESLEGQALDRSSNIFYSNLDQRKKNWTVQELEGKGYREIAQEIFSKTIKVA
ncbi:MAG: hypothetical protein KFB93_04605 [Simkaniaceae bacterium]|nr:MAG: hypothetical protein KFB93_04605 [Simkaniaceae bacterium]